MRTKLIVSLVILSSFILSGCALFGGAAPEDKSRENGEEMEITEDKIPTSGDLTIEDKKKDETPEDGLTEEPPADEEPPSEDGDEVSISPIGTWTRAELYVNNELQAGVPAKLTINDDGTFASSSTCEASGTVEIDTVNSKYTLAMTGTNCEGAPLVTVEYSYTILDFGEGLFQMTTVTGPVKEVLRR